MPYTYIYDTATNKTQTTEDWTKNIQSILDALEAQKKQPPTETKDT